MPHRFLGIPTLLCLLAPATLAPTALAQAHWPQWRGPLGTGESKQADPPLRWSATENIRWKAPIPGAGKSTPIVWGDLVFVQSAEGFGEPAEAKEEQADGGRGARGVQPTQRQRFHVIAYSRKDGSVVWQDVAHEALPHEGTHGDGSWASGSPATDGQRLFAFFGSHGLYAYDLAGKKLWSKQLGKMQTRNAFGEGSSPGLFGGTLVVQWDHEGEDFIVALDTRDGAERWRRKRDEPTTWATPLIVEVEGRPQVITNGTNKIRSYDLKTGDLVWECGGMTTNAIPSPVVADGIAYLMSGFRGNALVAIRLAGAKGDVTGTEAVVWKHERDTPYVPSPLLADGQLFFMKTNSGIFSVHDAQSGEQLFGPERLSAVSNVYASPVAAAGRVYFAGRDGEVEVRGLGGSYELLATNVLADRFDASPALAEDEIYLRGAAHLYCIGEPREAQ